MAKKAARAKGKTRRAGRKVGDLIPVSVTSAEEHWNTYKLSDGTTVRARPIMIEIGKQHNKFDDKGNPVYTIKGATVYDVNAAPRLRKKK